MAHAPDPETPSPRTLAILDDLDAGMPPREVAVKHGVSRQWVHVIRKRAGLPLPSPPPKAPKPPTPKPVKQPRPIPARTVAVIEDMRAGLRYRDVAARHGITEFHVGRLARHYGVARSQTDPDWHKQPTRTPETRAIVRDLQAGDAYAEVAARYGRPLKSIYNMAFRYGIRRRGKPEGP